MNSPRLFLLLFFWCTACQKADKTGIGTFGFDAGFIEKNTAVCLTLHDESRQSQVLVSADYQGRIMTSTATGEGGTSFGWINYDLIATGKKNKQFNAVGGEERIWLGPEGGQFSFYFEKGDSFDIQHWQVPALIDTIPFDVDGFNSKEAVFSRRASLTNYSGTLFDIYIERKISLLERSDVEQALHLTFPEDVRVVGYKTENAVENRGPAAWTQEGGLPSVWLLGMMKPSDETVVIIPFSPVKDARHKVTTSYFGEIPEDRIQILDSMLYFKCDGKYRSKIGLPPSIAKSIAASFDFQNNTLSLIRFSVTQNAPYVNSKWEIQAEPFQGDVVNSYNDGPLDDGTQMGPFYELESSSPALALSVGEKQTYTQTTIHCVGNFTSLQVIAHKVLGVDLTEIRNYFH